LSTTNRLRYPGAWLREFADKPAIVMAETGASISFAELDARANRLARFYRGLGLLPQDHVAYCVENRLECPALQWGAHYAGLYFTFVSTRLTPGETAYIVHDCGARTLVVSAATDPRVIEAVRALPNAPRLYTLDEARPELPALAAAIAGVDASPLENAIEGSDMVYSSGTSGRPKGVKPRMSGKPLGTTNVVADLAQRRFGCDAGTVYLSPAPFYHAAPMRWTQAVTALGGTVVMMSRFDAEGVLRALEQYRITHSQWVPTMFHRLLALPAEVRSRYDLSRLRVAIHAAAPCPIPTKHAMIDWWGPIITEYYGCSENVGMTMTDSHEWLTHPGTVGRPIYGELHILDDEGREVPAGAEGTVYFANTLPFSYHNDPEKTREAYNAAGWASVGDVGRVDAEGYLYLTDRKSNMIISGGVNVYPQETENVLLGHPAVADAAVIGVPHDDLGEEVFAVVQLEPGHEPGAPLAEELIAYCRERLSRIKCPRGIDFRETLPREPTGKLLKRLLRDEYRARHAAATQPRPAGA
jgi:fatty-acyl-CoA synthase